MHDPLVVAFEIRRPWPQRQLHSMTDARELLAALPDRSTGET